MASRTTRALFLLLVLVMGLAAAPGSVEQRGSVADAASVQADVSAAATSPAVRWAFYVTYSPNSWTSLQANVKNLTHVSPWYFYLKKTGEVTGNDDPRVTSLLRQSKVKNLPMLKNDAVNDDFTGIMTDTTRQLAVIDQVDSLITANKYDGITIDFESVNPTDKLLLTGFMQSLYARLHPKGKLVAMAVAAKAKDTDTGWSGAYDYLALSTVTDYILVMAYDYHWVNSNPGPVAPIDKVRDTANYTLSKVPAKKVILGLGVYGYDWGLKDDGTADGKAEYRTFGEADAIAKTPGSQGGFDVGAQSPYVLYTRDGKQREVWYENRQSFEAKMALVRQKGVAGFGLWRLGQEDPLIWPAIASTRYATACARVSPFKSTSTRIYFGETGHSLSGVFLRYWQSHGGLPVFGYPLTEQFTETSATNGKSYTVQYFERNRFEYHPENYPPNDVQLGLLGVQAVGTRIFPPADNPSPDPDTVYFPQVQHTLGGVFLRYWQSHGGLAQFGYPISEPVLERNPTDNNTYLVQYLQRARFEYHPEYAGTNSEVLLGLLGRDIVPCG